MSNRLIDNTKHGVWQLTKKGFSTKLTDEEVYSLFRSVHKQFQTAKGDAATAKEEKIDDEVVEDEAHSSQLIDILKALNATSFEKICKRFLTEIGIHDIVITGRSGDQGIDGIGIIKLNDAVTLISFSNVKNIKMQLHHIMFVTLEVPCKVERIKD